MDRDGVDAEVLYSEVSAFRHYPLMREGWREASEAFNRVLSRLRVGRPEAPGPRVPGAAHRHRLRRRAGRAARRRGARAVHIPTFPSEVGLPEYHDERYDPVWAAISEAGMSISQHLGLVQSLFELLRRDPTPQKAIFTSQPAMRLAETIGFWILPGVLARFPKLKIVLVEPSLGWVPFYLDILDSMAAGPYDFPALDDKPSSLLPPPDVPHLRRRSARPPAAPRARRRSDHVVDRLPHPATSWPNSQAVVEKNFAGIPDDERDLIVAGNAGSVYGSSSLHRSPAARSSAELQWLPFATLPRLQVGGAALRAGGSAEPSAPHTPGYLFERSPSGQNEAAGTFDNPWMLVRGSALRLRGRLCSGGSGTYQLPEGDPRLEAG